MEDYLEEWGNLEIKNFENHDELQRRLTTYINAHYEEDAIVDDKHLLMEFNHLKNTNNLIALFKTLDMGEPM